MLQRKITLISFAIALTVLVLMWVVFFVDYYFNLDLYVYGLRPRSLSGLIGIITSPFLHSTTDFSHILSNSTPAFLLTWLLYYHYRTIATRSFLFIYFFTGIMLWIFARDSYHVGMSGIIYGLTSFLVISGFQRKNMRVAGISLAIIFMYGSMIWGVFPMMDGVSWEAHAFGLFGGVISALYFREKGPQPAKMQYELEEEMGIEPEQEYWKAGYKPPIIQQDNEPKIIIKYTLKPKNNDSPKEN